RSLAELRHRSTGNAAAIDPVLHGASLRPGREMEHAKARVLAPPGKHRALAGSSDASAHGFDFALVFRAERIVSLDLGDVGHSPPPHRERVLALPTPPATCHRDPRLRIVSRCTAGSGTGPRRWTYPRVSSIPQYLPKIGTP